MKRNTEQWVKRNIPPENILKYNQEKNKKYKYHQSIEMFGQILPWNGELRSLKEQGQNLWYESQLFEIIWVLS